MIGLHSLTENKGENCEVDPILPVGLRLMNIFAYGVRYTLLTVDTSEFHRQTSKVNSPPKVLLIEGYLSTDYNGYLKFRWNRRLY